MDHNKKEDPVRREIALLNELEARVIGKKLNAAEIAGELGRFTVARMSAFCAILSVGCASELSEKEMQSVIAGAFSDGNDERLAVRMADLLQ